MNILKKFGLSLTLMGLAFISSGCNIMSLPYFLLMSDPKHEAELQSLAPKDKKTEKKT